MKPLSYLLFAVLFSSGAFAQDPLDDALEGLRLAEEEAQPAPKGIVEGDETRRNFDELAGITEEKVMATMQEFFQEEWEWAQKQKGPFKKERTEHLFSIAEETTSIRVLEPKNFPFHVKRVKAEMGVERWEHELFDGDLPPKQAAAELKKAKQQMKAVEIEQLHRDIEELKEEIREVEAWDIEAEVEEMIIER